MALKFLSDAGSGATSDAIEAIDYMTMMKTLYGVNIVASNNSWGGGGFSQALEDSIQRSIDAGIVFVAAAGNDGLDNDAIPVLSGQLRPGRDHFRGGHDRTWHTRALVLPTTGPRPSTWRHLAWSILSTTPGNTYSEFSGTSMASPHVTGVIGLLASVAPSASVAATESCDSRRSRRDPGADRYNCDRRSTQCGRVSGLDRRRWCTHRAIRSPRPTTTSRTSMAYCRAGIRRRTSSRRTRKNAHAKCSKSTVIGSGSNSSRRRIKV